MEHLEALIVTVVFAAAHLISPWAFGVQERARRWVASASGGLALAYVCLHLLPEINEGGELLGPRIYFVLLIGLATFYGLEIWSLRNRAEAGGQEVDVGIHIGMSALYSALLVFTLGKQLPDSALLTAFYAVTMGFHLLSLDLGLEEQYGPRYVTRYRYVLFAATWGGFLLSLIRQPHDDVVDVLTALLAGLILYRVFRRELPSFRDAHFRAFLVGMLLFLGMHVALA